MDKDRANINALKVWALLTILMKIKEMMIFFMMMTRMRMKGENTKLKWAKLIDNSEWDTKKKPILVKIGLMNNLEAQLEVHIIRKIN